MRSKEDAQDYRYFPDPDLLPLVVSDEWIEEIQALMSELPDEMSGRFWTEYDLTKYDARVLTQTREMAEYFETSAKLVGHDHAKLAANWVMGEVAASLNRDGIGIEKAPISATALGGVLRRIADGTISGKIAKEVFDAMWNGEGGADEIIEKRGLKQISDSGAIEKIVDEVLAANAKQVEDYRAGKDKAFNSLVGQVMKATKGKANPAQVNEILKRKLGR